ncbi:MAG: nucleoside triphosphate hydrolase [Robiginitomaculum sp.]|nr:MAG: nucleoside triphosphate hydrolase [Robiginitomaculum sp.]
MKRGRSRNNQGRSNQGRKPNPNRAFESNGPGVKVRGAASTIFEKYKQLAQDSTTSGDRVSAEYYYQYAEHYGRLVQGQVDEKEKREEEQRTQRDARQAEYDARKAARQEQEAANQAKQQAKAPEPTQADKPAEAKPETPAPSSNGNDVPASMQVVPKQAAEAVEEPPAPVRRRVRRPRVKAETPAPE